jgi:glycosyltransferase involved in cell wall biosynthesis
MQTTVSIILPVYNGERFIEKAILSVLTQTYTQWELLIIDDGSTDATAEIARKYAAQDLRILYVKNEKNLGIQKTLNKGISVARGKYIARIDADDAWIDARKLEAQVSFLQSRPEYILVGTGIVVSKGDKELYRFVPPETDAQIRKNILFKNCFTHSSVLFLKQAVIDAGGYSESAETKHVEDYDLWLKLGTIGKLANLPVYAVSFMVHEDSITARNRIEQFKKNMALVRKYNGVYPYYALAVLFGYIRVALYSLFGSIVPKKIQDIFVSWYKK